VNSGGWFFADSLTKRAKMTWYSASVIFLFEFKDGNQNSYDVWENVYLVEAESSEVAYEKAKQFAKNDEGDDDGSLTLDGRPVTRRYAGIRKLLTIANFNSNEDVPGDGAEISFSKYCVNNKEDLEKLINGDALNVFLYEE